MITLYDYYRSSASFRVRIALNLKDISYAIIPIHLTEDGGKQFSLAYDAINPQHLVPSLEIDQKILTQSLALIEYLDEIKPEPPLLPENPTEKAKVRAFALAIAADLHPLNNLRVLSFLTAELNISDDQKMKWYHHWMKEGLTALEKILARNPKSTFCFGEEITLADICLVPQLYNARRFNCDLTPYPNLVRVDAHCQTLQAVQDAWPKEDEKVKI